MTTPFDSRRLVSFLSSMAHTDKAVAYGIAAGRALKEVADEQDIPYLQAAAGISLLIMETVQRVRANKSQCMQLIAQIHDIICTLVELCADFGSGPSVPMLQNIARFTETLQKIHAYVRAQADLGVFKRIVKQAGNASRLDECKAGLQETIDAFGVQPFAPLTAFTDAAAQLYSGLSTFEEIAQMQLNASRRHEELMALVDARSDAASSRASDSSSNLRRSSSTLSLIPGSPKIFYGREQEVRNVVGALKASIPARVAVLGAGGMGKTTLALAVMHDFDVVSAFGAQRFFIPLYGACSATDMIGKIAAYFGVQDEGRPHKSVLRHLSAIATPILLVLDNMEDCWEPLIGRDKVEKFLALLTDVPNLHLMVTMRGAERPTNIKWTRPFLPVLTTLDLNAARRTFLDITDEDSDGKIVDKLLALTDHLPLAISLMANLVSSEGCETVLERWQSEKTSLLSEGIDKLSNLDKSIMLSVSSARMASNPNALMLLSILSILPSGISSSDLEHMNLPLPDVARCTSTLVRSSLSYRDNDHRFKVLAPIREYVRRTCPLPPSLWRPLRTDFHNLADLFKGPGFLSRALVHRLSVDLGNMRTVALYGLSSEDSDRADLIQTVACIVKIAGFTYLTTLGSLEGLDSLKGMVETLGDPRLCGQYLHIIAHFDHKMKLEPYSRLAIKYFEQVNDLTGQAKAYRALGLYYEGRREPAKAFEAISTSVALAAKAGDLSNQASSMVDLSQHYNMYGNTSTALRQANDAHVVAREAGDLWIEARAMRARATTCERLGDYSRGARLCAAARGLLAALALDSTNGFSVFRHILNTEAEINLQQTNYTRARALNMALTTPEEAQTGFSHQEISNGYALINIAYIDVATGNCASVDATLNLARALFQAHGRGFGLAACDITLGDLLRARGKYPAARALYLKSFASAPIPELQAMCLEKLSDVALATHDTASAQRNATLLLVLASRSGYQAKMLHALRRLGDVFLAQGDTPVGMLLFGVALHGFTLMGVHRARGECLLRIGDIQAAQGETAAARISWEAACPEFAESLQHEEVAECDRRLSRA
ncbi:hypothetical protein B0H17DRAFT_1180043 [Mycena rosella]|uniref:Novel STAND NTPase 1 domain-containing protein n=1 Tax=Mycena rosella TaxID=1033263 RepID=A0AAD7GGM8_MYCRO|nr:hypothetical protein B0H17DRAFT_1180043 [Mycena rosella]